MAKMKTAYKPKWKRKLDRKAAARRRERGRMKRREQLR